MNPNNSDQNNKTVPAPKPPKKVNVWRYRLIIGFLSVLIIVMLGGASYGGWYIWQWSQDKKAEITKLNDEVDTLKKERNLSVDDLQKKVTEQESKITDLSAENKRLSDSLDEANAKINQLTPKDIKKDFNYKSTIKINEAAGDVWLNPIYVDVTGDGKEDGIFAYRQGGTGGYLNVYVYSYLNTNTLTQLLKAEGYQKGTVAYLEANNVVEIKSEAGTPDAPTTASTKFKYDSAQKKMVKA